MQKSNELAQVGAKFITAIGDAMMYSWQLFIGQFSILLSTRWDAQPVLKLLLVLIIVAVVLGLVWRFIAVIVDVLAYIGALASYAFAALFSLGLVAALVNWLMRTVPTSLALN